MKSKRLFLLSIIGLLGLGGCMQHRANKERKSVSKSKIEAYLDKYIIELMILLKEFHYLDRYHLDWLTDACREKLEEKNLLDQLGFIFKPLFGFLKFGIKLLGIVMAVSFAVVSLGEMPESGIHSAFEIVSALLNSFGVKEVVKLGIELFVLAILFELEWCLITRSLMRDALGLRRDACKLLLQNLQFIKVELMGKEDTAVVLDARGKNKAGSVAPGPGLLG